MKKIYNYPTVEITVLNIEDVISASNAIAVHDIGDGYEDGSGFSQIFGTNG